jgi:hypothetical protein
VDDELKVIRKENDIACLNVIFQDFVGDVGITTDNLIHDIKSSG